MVSLPHTVKRDWGLTSLSGRVNLQARPGTKWMDDLRRVGIVSFSYTSSWLEGACLACWLFQFWLSIDTLYPVHLTHVSSAQVAAGADQDSTF